MIANHHGWSESPRLLRVEHANGDGPADAPVTVGIHGYASTPGIFVKNTELLRRLPPGPFYIVEWPTKRLRGGPSLESVAASIEDLLEHSPLLRGRRLNILAHSVGVLLTQDVLCRPAATHAALVEREHLEQRIERIVAFGAPFRGVGRIVGTTLRLMRLVGRLDNQAQNVFRDSRYLGDLRRRWTKTYPDGTYPFYFALVGTAGDRVVPRASSLDTGIVASHALPRVAPETLKELGIVRQGPGEKYWLALSNRHSHPIDGTHRIQLMEPGDGEMARLVSWLLLTRARPDVVDRLKRRTSIRRPGRGSTDYGTTASGRGHALARGDDGRGNSSPMSRS